MTTKEKKLLLLLGVLAALVLVVHGLPRARDYYRSQQEDIALLQERVQRYEQLIADTGVWQERALLKQAEMAEYADWIFQGDNPSLVGPGVQRSLRQAVEQSGVSVREMSVAKFARSGDWLIVSQDLSFVLDQDRILPFLTTLAAQRPRLFVTAFSVAQNRRQFTGSITVTAFSRAADAASAADIGSVVP